MFRYLWSIFVYACFKVKCVLGNEINRANEQLKRKNSPLEGVVVENRPKPLVESQYLISQPRNSTPLT